MTNKSPGVLEVMVHFVDGYFGFHEIMVVDENEHIMNNVLQDVQYCVLCAGPLG